MTEHPTARAVIQQLVEALESAKAHVQELREAWERGVLREGDGKGGTRSNRNVDVEVELRHALTTAQAWLAEHPEEA